MDAIVKALSDIKMQIPRPILEEVFRHLQGPRNRNMIGLDDGISQMVIFPRVLVDCSLLGGDEMHLPLTSGTIQQVDNQTILVRFPKSITNERSILTVLGVEYSNPASAAWLAPVLGTSQSPHVLQQGKMMIDVHSPIPSTFTSRVILVGENTVQLTGFTSPPANFYLRCVLEYSERMASLSPRYYHHFSKLAVLAVKAFIFNQYELEVAEAQLSAGRELGKFGQIIDRYEDANDTYEEYLKTKWAKVAFMNDQPSYHTLLRSMIRAV